VSRCAGLVVSIVSHGHGEQVRALLAQLAQLAGASVDQVVLTLNQAEPDLADALDADAAARPWPFALQLHQNLSSQGFGANHNQAFRQYALPHWRDLGLPLAAARFAVLNPDIGLQDDPFAPLLALLADQPKLGCAYPVQLNATGQRQDFERLLPTPAAIAQRLRFHLRARSGHAPGVAPGQPAPGQAPDWVNAAFWLVRGQAWRDIDGFDPHYFMYGEDVDFCLRLQLAGWGLQLAPAATVVHEAQRGSHRQLQHGLWHLNSLWQLWQSKAYADFKRLKRQPGAPGGKGSPGR
jgi:hypothetical protein